MSLKLHLNFVLQGLHELVLGDLSFSMWIKFSEGINCIELRTLAHYTLSQLLDLHLLFWDDREQVLNGGVGTTFTSSSALGLGWLVKLRHKLTCYLLVLLLLRWCAFRWSWLLTIIPIWLLHLGLNEAILLLRDPSSHIGTSIDLDIRCIISVILLVFIDPIRSSTMNSVFPALIELRILTPHVVVEYWRLFNWFQSATWMLPMHIFISTRAAHLDHINHVLCVGIFLLPQVEHFEFLPHRWIGSSRLNIAERAQGLLRLTVFFRVREALVLFDLSESGLFFHAKFDVIECFVWKTDQIRSDGQRKLSEWDLSIWLITKSAQDSIDVLFQNFLLELKEEVFDVFKVQEAKVALVNHAEYWNCVEFLHGFKSFLLNFDLDVIMDLFFEESGKFKLDVGLQSIVASDLIVQALWNFRSQRDIVHREYQLEETVHKCDDGLECEWDDVLS